MDLEALKALIAVSENGSFAKAAQSLNYARATLRRRIDELEVSMGARLLDRTSEGATATAAGRVLVQRGRTVLKEASALYQAVQELEKTAKNNLRIAAPVGPPHWVAPVVWKNVRTMARSARIRVDHVEDPLSLNFDDLAFVIHQGTEPPQDEFFSRRISAVEICLMATEDYLKKRGTPTTLEELKTHSLLYHAPVERDDFSIDLRTGGTVPVEPEYVSNDADFLRSSAARHGGILYGPYMNFSGRVLPDPNKFRTLMSDAYGREVAVWLVTRRSAVGGRLVEIAAEQISRLVSALTGESERYDDDPTPPESV